MNTKSHEKRKRLEEKLQHQKIKRPCNELKPEDIIQPSNFSSLKQVNYSTANDLFKTSQGDSHRWSSGNLQNYTTSALEPKIDREQRALSSRRPLSYPMQYPLDQQNGTVQYFPVSGHPCQLESSFVGPQYYFNGSVRAAPVNANALLSSQHNSDMARGNMYLGHPLINMDEPSVMEMNAAPNLHSSNAPAWLFETSFNSESAAPTSFYIGNLNLPSEHPNSQDIKSEEVVSPDMPNSEPKLQVINPNSNGALDPSYENRDSIGIEPFFKIQNGVAPAPIQSLEEKMPLNGTDDRYELQHFDSIANEHNWAENASFTTADSSSSCTFNSQISNSDPPSPMCYCPPNQHLKECFVGLNKQQNILQMLQTVPHLSERSHMMTPDKLGSYLKLFWLHFDAVYPIIHQPTFVADEAQPELLAAMMIIGMTSVQDQSVYELAIDIHLKFRSIIFSVMESQPHLPLWIHQCLLLTNYFARILSRESLHEMSQIFHATNIAHIKMSGYLSSLTVPTISLDEPLDENTWLQWVNYESKKRAAFFAFICDTQHATLFSHTQTISVFQINLELPSTDMCWKANDETKFFESYSQQPRQVIKRSKTDANSDNCSLLNKDSFPKDFKNSRRYDTTDRTTSSCGIRGEGHWPGFNFSIRRMMSPNQESQKEYSQDCFSSFSRLILLHGLMSIWSDVQSRALVDMGIMSKRRMNEFRLRMLNAIKNWKLCFDRHFDNPQDLESVVLSRFPVYARQTDGTLLTGANNLSATPGPIVLNFYERSPLLCLNWALYHMSLVSLYADFPALKIFAEGLSSHVNSTHNNNQIPTEDADLGYRSAAHSLDQLKAQKAISIWATSDDSKHAAWYSSQFLTMVLENSDLAGQDSHILWSVFLCTLTLWAYEVTRSNANSEGYSSTPYIDRDGQQETDRPIVKEELAHSDSIAYLNSIAQSSVLPFDKATKTVMIATNFTPPRSPSAQIPYSCGFSHKVLALVAYTYSIMEKHGHSINKPAILILSRIIERYGNES